MNELQVLRETAVLDKPFKIYGDEENPVFLAKDVAEWIGHSDVSMMVKGIDSEEKGTSIVCTLGGNQTVLFLTEDGLYEVLMQSRLPIAKEFKRQVKAVLREIRKTGSYGGSPIIPNLSLSGVKMRELRLLYQVGAISRAAVGSFLFAPETKTPNSGIKVQKNVQTPALPVIPPLDTFLSLPDFAGWREKLENMDGCFERFGVRLIQNRAGAYELAIDHNHKALLKLAGKDYKAKLRTDPAYIETRQVYIARCQVSAMMFDWEKVRCR